MKRCIENSGSDSSSSDEDSSDTLKTDSKKKKKKKDKTKKKSKKTKTTKKTKKKKKRKKEEKEKPTDKDKNNKKNKEEVEIYKLSKQAAPSIVLARDSLGEVTKAILKKGTGGSVSSGRIMSLHCKGWYFKKREGKKKPFWNTREDGKPYLYRPGTGNQIKGWQLAVPTMRQGELATITIAAHMAYGAEGLASFGIPPNAHLTYEIEVLEIT